MARPLMVEPRRRQFYRGHAQTEGQATRGSLWSLPLSLIIRSPLLDVVPWASHGSLRPAFRATFNHGVVGSSPIALTIAK